MSDEAPSHTRRQRLEIFFERMNAAPPACTHDEAKALLDGTLNGVEDEFSGVPFDEGRAGTDGRMYPPSEKFLDAKRSGPNIRCYRQTAHATFIADNGAIEIRPRRGSELGDILFEKHGGDGRKVSDINS